ncbi:YicC family protein [Clostridium sp. SYSU_GA19001]|uniref:YicC/YloC family endoribonuclease n=1 Tax=Clostridium caldaquaticum TaxID=2940653 RepID=UPI002076D8D1|nr:YicC/YloC family endoribonuclease [Clostridium caldaquaticum]MCM8710562.1 YicC family protein [Clostridium caldaquaticum]
MLKSMTGFGRGSIEESGKSFIVEIKSVNHRYLDLNIKMPRNLISLEEKIRNTISKMISRGKVDVFITLNSFASNNAIANFNYLLADSYVECLQEIKDRYNVKDDISVSLISRFPEVITLNQQEEDLDKVWSSLSTPLNEAISLLIAMREREGLKLKEDIIKRCDYIKDCIDKISKRSPMIVKEYKEKLEKRINDLLNDTAVDESRLALEVALFADKVNIDEEIVRLNSHLIQLKETLELNESIGRKLDFIVQEMNREINTIASKANDLELVNIVLSLKNEVEKIREQVQNVE